ncbi:MAG TPA: hypothetical protein VE974_20000 [Thermoanaerobaculia bacterium]|nr:hypothetical protein [Thermoanaerobaculia bacterium]
MFTFQAGEEFEPSATTKRWWLFTHKTERTVAGITLPGLFQTTHYEWQLFGFLCIFLLEGFAIWQSHTEGVVITAILTTILLDFVLAVISHAFQAPICRLKNELVYASADDEGRLKRQLRRRRLWQQFFYLLILISAGLKVYWFYSVYQQFDAKAIFIATCYILGGILHIFCTGYAVFTAIHESKLRGEHNQYLDSGRKNFKIKDEMTEIIPIECIPGKTGYAQVELDDLPAATERTSNGASGRVSRLRTKGILTDGDLHWLIAFQKADEQMRTLATYGVKHQMEILYQEPVTGVAK